MILVHYGASEYDPSKLRPIVDHGGYNNKPSGGLWTSPVDSLYGWRDWCRMYDYEDCAISFKLKFCGSLLVINCADDLDQLTWIKNDYSNRPIFSDLVKDYDAIHLTARGQKRTCYAYPHECSLSGWDCETVLIFNPESITPL